jgi:hypothetical protein
MNAELAESKLKAVKEVFDKFGIEFWLNSGTLLGAVRDGKIIEWDNDIDLSMWENDRKKLFLALHELKRKKFNFTVDPLFPNIGVVKLRLFQFDCPVEIDLWHIKGDKFINPHPMYGGSRIMYLILYVLRIVRHYLFCNLDVTVPEKIKRRPNIFAYSLLKSTARILAYFLPMFPLKLRKFFLSRLQYRKLGNPTFFFTPKRYFEKLETINFYELTFRIPFDVEDYLKYHYGENWRIPKENWQWWKDDEAHNWLQGFEGSTVKRTTA